jgi:hypothetical protein
MVEQPNGVRLDEGAPEIAEAAARLGDYLRWVHEREQRGRDDAPATAFPRTGSSGQQSRVRYANQFVGAFSKDGRRGTCLTKPCQG